MGEELEKMVVRPHHRRRTAIVVTAATAIAGAQALTLTLVLRREPALSTWTPPTFVVHETAPVIVEQVLAAKPTGSRPACPPVGSDAPSAKSLVNLPDDVSHVVAAHSNASWIAAWNDDVLRASFDGGRTWNQLLDGPGAVREVTFDCYGRLAVIRGDQLGTRDGATESWRKLPHVRGDSDAPIALVGGGPDIVVVGISNGSDSWEARVAVTPDLGASWWFRDVIDYWETSNVTGRQDPDGSIHMTLTTADCMSDPVAWVRIRDGIVETEELGSVGDVGLYGDIAINRNWRDGVRWKRWGEADWRAVRGLPDIEVIGAERLVSGPLPRVVVDGVLYRIQEGRATRLRELALRTEVAAVDRAGRVWWLADGEQQLFVK